MNARWKERCEIFRDPLFLSGLLIKFAFLFTGGSGYLTGSFIPFLDRAAASPLSNPWTLSAPEAFPYGTVLYLLLIFPKLLLTAVFGDAALGAQALSFFAIKAPLLFFDALLLWILSRFAPGNDRRLLILYWLNPILFYVTFVYGQLDVVSISLCTLGLFLLIKKKHRASAIVLACALLSKFQVAIALPLAFAYVWNNHFRREAVRQIAEMSALILGIVAVGFIPLAMVAHVGYVTAGSPEALRLFAVRLPLNATTELYLGIAALGLVLSRLVLSTRLTAVGLVFGAGLLFGTLLLVTDPMPGWFYWSVPFLALMYALRPGLPRLLPLALVSLYFLHFTIVPQFDFSPLVRNVVFTLLQTTLFLELVTLFVAVLRDEAPLKFRLRPLMIGLSGDSGSGKDHFTKLIMALLGEEDCQVFQGDDYHKWERGNDNWSRVTHLNPTANHLLTMQAHARDMVLGKIVFHPHYDHTTGRFTRPRALRPAKTIVFQGLHSLYLRALRETMDLRIFLLPAEEVRTYWKLRRDVTERGHSPEKVMASLQQRRPDSAAHIQPQKSKSDWIIEALPDGQIPESSWSDRAAVPPIKIRHTFFNDEAVGAVFDAAAAEGMKVDATFPEESDRIQFEASGSLSREAVERIAQNLFPALRPVIRGRAAPVFASDFDGLNQLLLISLIERRLR